MYLLTGAAVYPCHFRPGILEDVQRPGSRIPRRSPLDLPLLRLLSTSANPARWL
jgi:hypothetical protein